MKEAAGKLKGYTFFKVSVQQRTGQRTREERVTTRMSCSPKSMSAVMVGSPEGAWWKVFGALFISML
jgi:hypothetical protein